MRRILIALVTSAAVVIAAPTGALAEHHQAHHHARHHARHHRSSRRHSRVRHERFGRRDATQPGSSGQAGTVTSFTDNGNGTGVLTITLSDGSMVTGNVTNDTNLECMAPNANPQDNNGDNGDDNGNSGDNNANSGDDNGDNANSGDDNGGGDDNGDNGDDNGGQMCSTSSLTPGTAVAEANLEISGSGAVWNRVELITS